MDHVSHFGIANPTQLQVHSPNSSLDYNLRRRIEATLCILAHTKNDIKKWLHFLRKQGISRPQVDLKTVVLTNSEDKDDLHFFQLLRQETISTPQSFIDSYVPLVVSGSSKPSHSKSKKKKQKISIMFCQARFILSPKLERLIFTQIEQSYTQKLKKITTSVKMGKDEKKWALRVRLVGLFEL